MGPPHISVEHTKKLIEQVHAGTLEQELHDAIAYCKAAVVHPDWLIAVGSAAAVATPKEVLKKLVGDHR